MRHLVRPCLLSCSLIFLLALLADPALADPPVPVTGGTPVERGAWPDVVAVRTADGGLCSGTLLAADLVLTAGHCVAAGPTEVIVGSVDLARPDGDRRAVKWSRSYPDWLTRYDVGVVMLENPVLARQRAVAQGCTPRDRLVSGTRVRLVGFGLTSRTGEGENTRLHEATLRVMDGTCGSDRSCRRDIAPGGEFTAGGRGADACFGDSGGPVYIDTASGPALVGIVSRGLIGASRPCGDGGVYVRADKVVAWVQNVTGRILDRVPCDRPADDGGELDDAGCASAGRPLGGMAALAIGAAWAGTLRRARRRAFGRPR